MEFFKSLAELLDDGQQLTMTVKKKSDRLTVSILPATSDVKDKAVENIVPVVLSGTPAEFEDGFLDAIKDSLPKATGLVSNIKEYEDSVEKAKAATAMAKKEKEEKDKQKKEFDGYIELARQNLKEEKFLDAKKCLDKAAAVNGADKALIEKARKAIAERSGEGSLFAGPVDKSDGKNITLNKDLSVPNKSAAAPAPTSAPAQAPAKEEANAFAEAMDLPDDDETDEDNQDEEE